MSRCPSWVKGGNTRSEHMLSESHQIADVSRREWRPERRSGRAKNTRSEPSAKMELAAQSKLSIPIATRNNSDMLGTPASVGMRIAARTGHSVSLPRILRLGRRRRHRPQISLRIPLLPGLPAFLQQPRALIGGFFGRGDRFEDLDSPVNCASTAESSVCGQIPATSVTTGMPMSVAPSQRRAAGPCRVRR